MSGPRDLRRGRKPFERPCDPKEVIGDKSYFTFEPFGQGFALNVHRRGYPVQTILVKTEGELNRERRRLSDEGLIGLNRGAI
ncbi:hypothetical protein [Consotaella salsifontis]|uniref:Uncharacterized protein n=1 Tax=Consotaella salsifontis TaxID=1365950 RepID=A0A1T4SJC8_9HYPH|nr:hypothetical protein [Consotaella salsifontis]SKA28404.1 hypothetical protein SAMN05428963_11177 [Consotaella salsifontis]